MDDMQNTGRRPVNPRRKKRTKMQIFKEVYLPVVIAGAAVLMIFIFIIGSITRAIQNSQYNAQVREASSLAESRRLEKESAEAEDLLKQAAKCSRHFDYAGAIELLESFSGDTEEFPEVENAIAEYTAAQESLVLWNDPSKVLNLSFQLLIADPQRAFNDATYGNAYARNFVTTDEFSRILRQLYENGYILVGLEDVTNSEGPLDLYLPEGKKPLILTQTNVNYNTYMIDSDGDKLPDKDGDGFASKLVLDANGNITCEMVDAQGDIINGAFDLVPILDSFVATHPDFSYKGAKAVLALTGYDGLFGYRTNPAAEETFGAAAYAQEIDNARQIAQVLRSTGYELACYTYENVSYAEYTTAQINDELERWRNEVRPILGFVNILVYAQNQDISPNDTDYTGDKFNSLYEFGFRYYLGFCKGGEAFYASANDHIRMGRILVSGANLTANPTWFQPHFDPSEILDPSRSSQ